MPALRQNKQSSSPVETPNLNHSDDSTPLGFQFNTLSLAPIAPDTATSPLLPAKKKRSHGKAKPPGHIPRPPNAFIIFRTEYIRSMAKQNSTPEVSKDLGLMWRNMPPSEKQHWIQRADAAKVMHKLIHPEYKFKPVHRRDEFGNYIRKPRRPNRPRMKAPGGDDAHEHLPGTCQSLEGKPDAESPNTALPSEASSASSPPASPSPTPSLAIPSPSPPRLFQRRSSSVPLAGSDDNFLGTASSFMHPYPPGLAPSQYSRRYSKRPSTSMDYMSAGLAHAEPYMCPNATDHLSHPSSDPSMWRPGYRRSISAPDFSSEIPSNFTYSAHNVQQEANPLTPINPVFGSVFERFSWNTPQTPHVSTNPQNAQDSFSAMQPYVPLGDKRQEYITVQIPETAISPTSDLLSTTTSHLSTPSSQLSSMPAILQPAPVATFDFAMFQAQVNEFEFEATAAQGGFEGTLGGVAQVDKVNIGMYHGNEPFFANVGDGHSTDHAPTAAMQGTQTGVFASQSSSDAAFPPAVDHAADLQAYQDGVRYTRICPEITPPRVLNLNDLIVDGY